MGEGAEQEGEYIISHLPKPAAYDSTSEGLLASYLKRSKNKGNPVPTAAVWDPHPTTFIHK